MSRLGSINLEKQQARAAAEGDKQTDVAWCQARLGNLVAAWQSADAAQRSAMLGEIFSSIEVDIGSP